MNSQHREPDPGHHRQGEKAPGETQCWATNPIAVVLTVAPMPAIMPTAPSEKL